MIFCPYFSIVFVQTFLLFQISSVEGLANSLKEERTTKHLIPLLYKSPFWYVICGFWLNTASKITNEEIIIWPLPQFLFAPHQLHLSYNFFKSRIFPTQTLVYPLLSKIHLRFPRKPLCMVYNNLP